MSLTNYDFKTEFAPKVLEPGKTGEIIFALKEGTGKSVSTFKDFLSTRSHLDDEYLEANLEYYIEYGEKKGNTYKSTFYVNYDSKCRGSWVDPNAQTTEKEDKVKISVTDIVT